MAYDGLAVIRISAYGARMKIAAVRRFALSLPETAEEPHFEYSSFRVKGKIFATVPPDGEHLHIFVGDEDREPALELYPEFVEKLPWGRKIVGLRVTLAKARAEVVLRLLERAWRRKAPKVLLASRAEAGNV
jgi:hypothetical protein